MSATSGYVLQVITDRDRRGPQVFSIGLGSALADRGWKVATVALVPGRNGADLPAPAMGRRPYGADTLLRLRRRIARVSVVIGHGSSTLPACASAAVGSRSALIHRNLGEPGVWADTPRRRLQLRTFLRAPDVVVALWPGAADQLVMDFGVRAERIRIIPRGVSGSRFAPADPDVRAETARALGVHSDRPVVAFVGALTKEKNAAAAVRAVGRIDGVQLLIAGEGPERSMLRALANDLAPGRVWFLGSVATVEEVFRAADAVVLPSLTEGIPAVLIEAGMSGVPAVATGVGGVAEVVEDGVTGRLVDPLDQAAIDEALRDVLARAEGMGARARERCMERFELGAVAASWDRLLREVSPA